MKDNLLWKVWFLITLFSNSLSLVTFAFKDLKPEWIRKILVILFYPISWIPKIGCAFFRWLLHEKSWKEFINNYKIALNGYIGNGN